MAISRFKTSSVAQGLPKFQDIWDQTTTTRVIDFLIVSGGGGGRDGYPQGVGGGGGRVGIGTIPFATGTNYTVTVGGGGARNSEGVASTFNALTMAGGGLGDGTMYFPSRGGGSGKNINGVATTYIGGQTANSDNSRIAGGGGAGAGANGLDSSPYSSTTPGSIGGDGVASDITGTSIFYGGGGNGGNMGTGSNNGWGAYLGYIPTYRSQGGGGWGGGQSPSSNPAGAPTAGTVNLGGGGGGGTWDNSNPKVTNSEFGAAGGSGVVILRYPVAFTMTIGAGLTGSTVTSGGFKITTITAGTGNVSLA
jgi:hypothetical protein